MLSFRDAAPSSYRPGSTGIAFAMRVTSCAGYFVIPRGTTFNIGDRIPMVGVRGDVIWLRIIQTMIMEMGRVKGENPSGVSRQGSSGGRKNV